MKIKNSKRDVGIELARILGCLIVIGVHISLSDQTNGGEYDLSRGFINCLLADGVAIFWLITGCFLFSSNSYSKVLARTIKTIIFPMIAFQIFCLHFSGWISEGGYLFQSILQTSESYFEWIKASLALNTTIPRTGHLWYCYAYILVILAFPMLKAFVVWLDEDIKREKWFCGMSFILLALNDYSLNTMFAFSHHGLNAAVPAAIEIIWGHILYRHKEKILNHEKKNLCFVILPLCFVMLNFIRMNIVKYTNSNKILYWYSTIGLLCGICVLLFCIVLGNRIRKDSLRNSVINGVASYTFLIYLIHIPVRTILYRYNIHTKVLEWLHSYFEGFVLELLYTIVFIGIVFGISLIVSLILRRIYQMLKGLYCFIKQALYNKVPVKYNEDGI